MMVISMKAPTATLLLLLVFIAHPIFAQSTAPTSTSCFSNPTQESCRSFTMPDQDINTQLEGLCAAMPYMVGCSLWNSCQNNAASGPFCQPMSLYGTICEEMGEMYDCTPYNQLCFTSGSVVEQCKTPGPLPGAPSTARTVQAVLAMCSTHSMPGCEDCTARSTCPHPLETLSKLCHGMPGMSQCADFFNMCSNSAVETTFSKICDEDDSNPDTLPPMKMWMHAGTYDILLFKEWIPRSTGQYAGYCIMCIVAAVVVQGLKAWRVRMEARWASAYRVACCETAACGTAPAMVEDVEKRSGSSASSEEELQTSSGAELSASTSSNSRRSGGAGGGGGGKTCCGKSTTPLSPPLPGATELILPGTTSGLGNTTSTNGLRRRFNKHSNNKSHSQNEIAVGKNRWQFIFPSNEQMVRNVIRGSFTFVIVFLDYMLMLLVMSFNIGIIFSTVAGFALGALLFGHWGERVGTGSAVAAGDLAPDCENDLEVHFMEAQTCCNSRHV